MKDCTNRMGRPPRESRTLLGVRVQSLRMEKGWTQEKLAAKAGLALGTIGGIESGRQDPNLFSAICLADALGVSLDFLATGRGNPNKTQ